VSYPLTYSLVLSNAGPGPANGLRFYDTLPTNTLYAGSLAPYGTNDPAQWQCVNILCTGNIIELGPFNVPSGQSLTVQMSIQVLGGAGGTTIVDRASAVEADFNTAAVAQSCSSTVGIGTKPSVTSTFTVSPTSTPSPTITPTASPTASPSVTPTSTPAAQLSLYKSANKGSVSGAGDTLTYVLALSNIGNIGSGPYSVWDTLPYNFSYAGSSPSGTLASGLLSWSGANVPGFGGMQAFTVWGSVSGAGSSVQNQAQAGASSAAGAVFSNLCAVAVGATFTNSPSPTNTPTSTLTPSPTATPTIAYQAPALTLNMVQNEGVAWPTGGAQNLGFSITFSSLTGCVCATAPDLTLYFTSDTKDSVSNPVLNAVQAMSVIGLAGPVDPMKDFYWQQTYPANNTTLDTGVFSALSPGLSVNKEVYAWVNPSANQVTVTSQAVLVSQSWGIALTATVQTLVYKLQPTPTPIPPTPTASPTPVAALGHAVAYPSPASDTLCIAYYAPQGGPLKIEVYNLALQRVAVITDQAQGGRQETACVPIRQLAVGAYFYRASVGGYQFPTAKFGVLR